MPYEVGTDLKVVPFGENKMVVFDQTGTEIIIAQRNSKAEDWFVTSPVAEWEESTSGPRSKVLQLMLSKALDVLPQQGFSALVPHGLVEME